MSANPFDSDNEDDFKCKGGGVSARRETKVNTVNTYTKKETAQTQDDDFNFYDRQIESAMQASLASTQRSRQALEEAEDVGVSTAEDLLKQGDQLRKVDKNLDEIKASTYQTQGHLNNIKSVFGGMKNYFTRKKSVDLTKEQPLPDASNKLRGTITTGSGNDSSSSMAKSNSYTKSGPSLDERSREAIAGTKWAVVDQEIDENLDAMSERLRSLQNLGKAMGDEINTQNELLDRVGKKAGDADIEVRKQDKQMRRILGSDKKTTAPQNNTAQKYN